MIIDETYSAFVKEAGKTGGGPPPAVPPELPGDIVDGPPVVDWDRSQHGPELLVINFLLVLLDLAVPRQAAGPWLQDILQTSSLIQLSIILAII